MSNVKIQSSNEILISNAPSLSPAGRGREQGGSFDIAPFGIDLTFEL
jgi:hypothetical protein